MLWLCIPFSSLLFISVYSWANWMDTYYFTRDMLRHCHHESYCNIRKTKVQNTNKNGREKTNVKFNLDWFISSQYKILLPEINYTHQQPEGKLSILILSFPSIRSSIFSMKHLSNRKIRKIVGWDQCRYKGIISLIINVCLEPLV